MSPSQTAVVEVFPAGAVPANLLRWHLVFDRLANDVGAEAIALLDRSGQPVRDAFVDLPEGLWDATGTRLTLLLHPGRIKRGLRSSTRFGGALAQGGDMCLQIDLDRLLDAGLGVATHRFVVSTAETRAVDPSLWRLGTVETGSLAPVAIGFDRAMDHFGVQEGLVIVGADGRAVQGEVAPAPDGRSALFHPSQPWAAGRHRLMASRDLEDVAGNRVDAAFECSPDEASAKSTSNNGTASTGGAEQELCR
jgi:hypothetical protein